MSVEGLSNMLESCLTFEPGFFEFRDAQLFEDDEQEAYVLGRKFTGKKDLAKLKKYVSSLLWFTYRKNFAPIGGTGPTSDQGWGCMLRCAQMLMGHALTVRHLGRSWQWTPENSKNEDYVRILKMFQDRKDCLYSLHQIAQCGVDNKRKVGDWFGPNTAAHVLKKLTVFNQWSGMSVHVALDTLWVHDDVRQMAYTKPPPLTMSGLEARKEANGSANGPEMEEKWRPLLIAVPLRLGLRKTNPIYLEPFRELFKIPQFSGILGGHPNHALYIVGMTGEKVIYLDPHVCQQTVNLEKPPSGDDDLLEADDEETFDDSTYHCSYLLHADYSTLDSSMAAAFTCLDEDDYKDLCDRLENGVLKLQTPLFNIVDERLKDYPKFVPYYGLGEGFEGKEFFDLGDPHTNSDEEFELLE